EDVILPQIMEEGFPRQAAVAEGFHEGMAGIGLPVRGGRLAPEREGAAVIRGDRRGGAGDGAGSGHGVAFLHKGPQAEAWRTIAAGPSAGASRIRFDGLARGLSALPGTPTAEGTIAAKAGRAQPRRLRITAGRDCCKT